MPKHCWCGTVRVLGGRGEKLVVALLQHGMNSVQWGAPYPWPPPRHPHYHYPPQTPPPPLPHHYHYPPQTKQHLLSLNTLSVPFCLFLSGCSFSGCCIVNIMKSPLPWQYHNPTKTQPLAHSIVYLTSLHNTDQRPLLSLYFFSLEVTLDT